MGFNGYTFQCCCPSQGWSDILGSRASRPEDLFCLRPPTIHKLANTWDTGVNDSYEIANTVTTDLWTTGALVVASGRYAYAGTGSTETANSTTQIVQYDLQSLEELWRLTPVRTSARIQFTNTCNGFAITRAPRKAFFVSTVPYNLLEWACNDDVLARVEVIPGSLSVPAAVYVDLYENGSETRINQPTGDAFSDPALWWPADDDYFTGDLCVPARLSCREWPKCAGVRYKNIRLVAVEGTQPPPFPTQHRISDIIFGITLEVVRGIFDPATWTVSGDDVAWSKEIQFRIRLYHAYPYNYEFDDTIFALWLHTATATNVVGLYQAPFSGAPYGSLEELTNGPGAFSSSVAFYYTDASGADEKWAIGISVDNGDGNRFVSPLGPLPIQTETVIIINGNEVFSDPSPTSLASGVPFFRTATLIPQGDFADQYDLAVMVQQGAYHEIRLYKASGDYETITAINGTTSELTVYRASDRWVHVHSLRLNPDTVMDGQITNAEVTTGYFDQWCISADGQIYVPMASRNPTTNIYSIYRPQAASGGVGTVTYDVVQDSTLASLENVVPPAAYFAPDDGD